MKKLKPIDIITIYFRLPPFLFGDGPIIFGLFILIKQVVNLSVSSGGLVIAGFFVLIGVLINHRKIKLTRWAVLAFKNGIPHEAVISDVESTSVMHNNRRVYKYIFTYAYAGQVHGFKFRSSYHRELGRGQHHMIFILPEKPKVVFIPYLFFADTDRFIKSEG